MNTDSKGSPVRTVVWWIFKVIRSILIAFLFIVLALLGTCAVVNVISQFR